MALGTTVEAMWIALPDFFMVGRVAADCEFLDVLSSNEYWPKPALSLAAVYGASSIVLGCLSGFGGDFCPFCWDIHSEKFNLGLSPAGYMLGTFLELLATPPSVLPTDLNCVVGLLFFLIFIDLYLL